MTRYVDSQRKVFGESEGGIWIVRGGYVDSQRADFGKSEEGMWMVMRYVERQTKVHR